MMSMNLRRITVAIGLCVLSACDAKMDPVATSAAVPSNPNPPLLRLYLTTTLVQPLEFATVFLDAPDASSRSGSAAVDTTWTSSDTSVATISGQNLRGVSPGDATITVSIGALKGSTVVHVGWRPDTHLFVGSQHFFLDVGTHLTLYPTLLEPSGRLPLAGRDVEWATSNPNIARVDSSGAITTYAAGTTMLIARFRGLVDSAVVDVGGLYPGFGYFYSGDAVITDYDYYGPSEFWTPAPGKSFSTAGFVSATWGPPYSSEPDLGWVGPNTPVRDAFVHVVSLENVPCTVYAQPDSGFHFVSVGSPLIDCYDSNSPYWQSVRMEFVAFRLGEFAGPLAMIYPNAPAVTTNVGGITQTSATPNSRSFAMPGVARDSVFWFVTPGAWTVGHCWVAPSDGSVSQAAVRVTCAPFQFPSAAAALEPAFYAAGFAANVRRGTAPIGFAEASNGVITRKAVNGLDIATTYMGAQFTDVVVSGAGLAAFDRVPAVLVTAIGLNSSICTISEPVRATPTTVTFTVRCYGTSAFTLSVIY
jgi:hypothetical protein